MALIFYIILVKISQCPIKSHGKTSSRLSQELVLLVLIFYFAVTEIFSYLLVSSVLLATLTDDEVSGV